MAEHPASAGTSEIEPADLRRLTAEIVSAHVSHNAVPTAEVANFITQTHAALQEVAHGTARKDEAKPVPAVSVRASIKPDYLVCLEDGKRLKMLKRYLAARYEMTPEDYRRKWGLPADYPMVAPNYAKRRSELAKSIGLGRKPEPAPTKKKSPRKAGSDASTRGRSRASAG
jgi:predicted transcriptional regulator